MPGMTGLELLPKAKALRPDVPLIMITAYGDAHTKQTALEQGAETLFTKPIDFGALRSEIDLRVERAPVKRPVVWSNVRYWHLADISFASRMSAFGGKADIMIALRDVPLMTQADIEQEKQIRPLDFWCYPTSGAPKTSYL